MDILKESPFFRILHGEAPDRYNAREDLIESGVWRPNQLTNMVDPGGATAFSWTDGGQLRAEDGWWASDTLTYTYTNRLRGQLALQRPGAGDWTQIYHYDDLLRLDHVASPSGDFSYGNQFCLLQPVACGKMIADVCCRKLPKFCAPGPDRVISVGLGTHHFSGPAPAVFCLL